MPIVDFQMKTHSRKDITDQVGALNPCIVHGTKPRILEIVAGRRKEVFHVALCNHEDCGKMGKSGSDVAAIWNKWNPLPETK